MEKKKVLVFGGTFNPVHNGHLIVARDAAEALEIDELIFVPNRISPTRIDSITDGKQRVNMISMGITGMNSSVRTLASHFEVNSLEPSYTINTIRHIKSSYGDSIDKPYFLIGPDKVKELVNWYEIDTLAKECIFVVGISSSLIELGNVIDEYDILGMIKTCESLIKDIQFQKILIPQIDIRSTVIRQRIQQGLSIRHMVPDKVEEYIRQNEIYKT